MLRATVIASGREYQEAAAWAAPTYVQRLLHPDHVSVLLPEQEAVHELLELHSRTYGFSIQRFHFRKVSDRKFTSQLKCQAFLFSVSRLADGDLLFLVDADTYCARSIDISPEIEAAIRSGSIGLVPDVRDRHCKKPGKPWFVPPEKRVPYVNSGVIVTARSAFPLFATFLALSEQPDFLRGPFNDQKVINYALSRFFTDKLIVLDKAYNGLRPYRSSSTIIGHCAGGAGNLGTRGRGGEHQRMCANILQGVEASTRSNSGSPPSSETDRWSGKLLVSLTTTSKRVGSLSRVLETICTQTRPADEIHLFLSREGYLHDEGITELPPDVALHVADHNIQVSYVANTGPYRKLLPLLERRWQEDVIIVTVDDDTLYPPTFLDSLVTAYERQHCIIAYCCRKVVRDSAGKLKPYREWPKRLPSGDTDIMNFPIGQAGVLHRPEFFTDRIFDPKALELCPYADDIWYRCNSWLKQVPACDLRVGTELHFPRIGHTSGGGLWKWNRSQNDSQLQAVARYLGVQVLQDHTAPAEGSSNLGWSCS